MSYRNNKYSLFGGAGITDAIRSTTASGYASAESAVGDAKTFRKADLVDGPMGPIISAILLITCIVICINFWYANMIWTGKLPKSECDKCSDKKLGGFIPGMGLTLLCGIMCGWVTGRFIWPFIIKKAGKAGPGVPANPMVVGGMTLVAFCCCFWSIVIKMNNWDQKMGMGLRLII